MLCEAAKRFVIFHCHTICYAFPLGWLLATHSFIYIRLPIHAETAKPNLIQPTTQPSSPTRNFQHSIPTTGAGARKSQSRLGAIMYVLNANFATVGIRAGCVSSTYRMSYPQVRGLSVHISNLPMDYPWNRVWMFVDFYSASQ